MKKRIIINGSPLLLKPSGLRSFTYSFLIHLSQRFDQYSFDIVVPQKIDESQFLFPPNCTIQVVSKKIINPTNMWFVLWDNIQIAEYVNSQNKDEVAFYLAPYHSFPLPKIIVPTCLILHDIHLWKNPDVTWPIEYKLAYEIDKNAVPQADHIFSVSEFTKNEALAFFPSLPLPVSVIYEDTAEYFKKNEPFNKSLLQSKYNLLAHDYFLYIGSFDPRKNISFLLKAYQQYYDKSTIKKKLVIVGSPLQRNVSTESVFPDGVIHVNRVSDEEKYQLYKGAFAFIYPSTYEGFGLQILEAQNAESPLLLSDIPVFREIAGDGADFFSLNSPDNLTQKLLEFETFTDKRADLITKGLINAKRFTWKKTVDIFVKQLNIYGLL